MRLMRRLRTKVGRISRNSTVLVVCDVQERLQSAIFEADRVLHNCIVMAQAAQIMELPIVVTEQYPQGLGPTVAPLRDALGDWYQPIEKTSFSCFGAERFRAVVEHGSAAELIIVGTESHVCVLQTALDATERGVAVHIPRDAVSSRTEANWITGIERMRQAGAFIGSVESVLFELLGTSEAEHFRAVQELIK